MSGHHRHERHDPSSSSASWPPPNVKLGDTIGCLCAGLASGFSSSHRREQVVASSHSHTAGPERPSSSSSASRGRPSSRPLIVVGTSWPPPIVSQLIMSAIIVLGITASSQCQTWRHHRRLVCRISQLGLNSLLFALGEFTAFSIQ